MQIDMIDPKKAAMIVVDMQNDFVAAGAPLAAPAALSMVPKLVETLNICRDAGIKVIYTAHVHRRDGCDIGLFDDICPPIANRAALIDGTPGVDIYPELAPAPGEHVIKKHRYSGFFGTDLDIILANGASIPSSFQGRRPKIAATQQHGTQCFGTTGSSFCQMRQQPVTTRTVGLVRCQVRRSTAPRW